MFNRASKSSGAVLAGVAVAAMLGGCVNNPQQMTDTLNTVNQVASTAQQLKGGGMPMNGTNTLAGAGGVADMANAQGDPRYGRAEAALKQINLSQASCKTMQSRQQATLDSLAEVEPLVANPMFRQQYERLRIQSDSLNSIARAKKCKLPTVASAAVSGSATVVGTGTTPVNYGKLSCSRLKTEYKKLGTDIAAAESAEKSSADAAKLQNGLNAVAQVAAVVGGKGGVATMDRTNQLSQVAGNLQGGAVQPPATGSIVLLQQRTDLEEAAEKKRCRLDS